MPDIFRKNFSLKNLKFHFRSKSDDDVPPVPHVPSLNLSASTLTDPPAMQLMIRAVLFGSTSQCSSAETGDLTRPLEPRVTPIGSASTLQQPRRRATDHGPPKLELQVLGEGICALSPNPGKHHARAKSTPNLEAFKPDPRRYDTTSSKVYDETPSIFVSKLEIEEHEGYLPTASSFQLPTPPLTETSPSEGQSTSCRESFFDPSTLPREVSGVPAAAYEVTEPLGRERYLLKGKSHDSAYCMLLQGAPMDAAAAGSLSILENNAKFEAKRPGEKHGILSKAGTYTTRSTRPRMITQRLRRDIWRPGPSCRRRNCFCCQFVLQ